MANIMFGLGLMSLAVGIVVLALSKDEKEIGPYLYFALGGTSFLGSIASSLLK